MFNIWPFCNLDKMRILHILKLNEFPFSVKPENNVYGCLSNFMYRYAVCYMYYLLWPMYIHRYTSLLCIQMNHIFLQYKILYRMFCEKYLPFNEYINIHLNCCSFMLILFLHSWRNVFRSRITNRAKYVT